jgi:hypothetical protein
MNAILEPRIVVAKIQGPFTVGWRSHSPARMVASSQGGLARLAIVHFAPGGGLAECKLSSWCLPSGFAMEYAEEKFLAAFEYGSVPTSK